MTPQRRPERRFPLHGGSDNPYDRARHANDQAWSVRGPGAKLTSMSTTINERDAALNTKIQAGDVLGALDEFYDDNVHMQEGVGEAVQGRTENKRRLEGFLGSLSKFNGATLHSAAVNGDVSLSEWTFDMVGGDGQPIVWNEVIRRKWEGGVVVHERYYNP